MGTISVLTGKDENKLIVICYTIISFVMTLAYILEFVKGNRTLGYSIIVTVLNLVPTVLCIFMYLKEKTSLAVRYFFGVGFSILYSYILLTANTNTTFVYIILVIILITVYSDIKLRPQNLENVFKKCILFGFSPKEIRYSEDEGNLVEVR
ncbi:MAG: hypothetical protein HGA25_04390, partial [Clostridiales bacterium]|nr:hypothetical protein [Clostridiales bacterium]